ncbi:MAG: holo-ACP synthase [Gammaproteobacteria bacterium]|nr:holo-ACP synthase [Gammaproteobacteria bacterium]MDH5729223.1 holo-ACP synthase [Gammaproteobacteria bacterium]
MILGIGTDIVKISRLAEALEKFGPRYADRILAEEELAAFKQNAHPARFLAKRFAAKEAAVKALGTGFSQGISMRHVFVSHDHRGKPELNFSQVAADFCRSQGMKQSFLSISDEKDYAIAYVILTSGATI